MKLKLFAAALLAATSLQARNAVTEVAKVSESVSLTQDVDYVITGDTPFGEMGSVDIQNTEHAVLIIAKMKPSKVISDLMSHIYINGEKAVNGTNCQVKMYNRGAIVFPYDKNYKPLTCYTEENYEGDSYNNYTEGSTGGFMKTLTKTQLNNLIKSFKLKRGYMVTFAVGTGGWGYSRCFIADQEDLEIASVPAPMNGKISSYRLFHWWNAHKAGGASSGDKAFNSAINASWCYDWAQGNASLLPDVEWVPNHIYEDWPSAATCGAVTGSCHMKTNNEPGNSADDHPQDVATVLGNWENLMRTGMRLCSESSHDGSWNHLRAFIDSIDARGWRCDLLDLHCYWGASSFGDFSNYYSSYGGRPIWISEWCWGASWNASNWSSGGIFAQAPDGKDSYSTKNQQTMYDNTKPILDKLNASKYVERYAFWNGEAAASKIYKDGGLSILGNYYATMNDGMGYNASIQKVPNIVYKAPSKLTSTYTKKSKTLALSWTDPNGDMLDSIVVEKKTPSITRWTKVGNVTPQDKTSKSDISYSYSMTVDEVGVTYVRVTEYYSAGKKFISDEASVTVAAANSIGALQYGQLKIASTDAVTTDLEEQEVAPYVVAGLISNKNTGNGITNQIMSLGKTGFKFRFYPWTLTTPVEYKTAETVDYLVLPPDTIFQLGNDMMLISQKIGIVKGDKVEVVFPTPYPEGVTPVVVAQQNSSVTSYAPVTVRISDVTNTGFSVQLCRQEGITTAFNGQNVNYFACTPGQVQIGNGKLLTVGRDYDTPCGGTARQTVHFKNTEGDTLHLFNPYIIAAPQTNNYAKTSVFRLHGTTADDEGGVYCGSFRRQVDGTSTNTETNSAKTNGDYVGWFIVSDDPNGTGDEEPVIVPTGIISTDSSKGFSVSVVGRSIYAAGNNLKAYNINGQRVAIGSALPAGVYVVTDGTKTIKLNVR